MNINYKLCRIKFMFKEKISEIFLKKINSPLLKNVFVSNVELSINFEYLDVFVVVGDFSNSEYVIYFLNKNRSFFRYNIAQYNLLKKVPKVRFLIDNYYYKNININSLIDSLKK